MSTYNEVVASRLDQVYSQDSQVVEVELDDLRLVLLSDQHKGQRDDADDFQQCEATYLAALEHYWQHGFDLCLVGDVEELWECWPEPVIDAYQAVFLSEQRFAEAVPRRRYTRFVGNHDDMWYDEEAVQRNLGPYIAGAPVIQGLRLVVHDQGQPLGELYMVHGHQGTIDSDFLAGISAKVVRYIWRPIQRLFNIKTSTPSTNYELRKRHELAMYSYAEGRDGLVLLAGHTHHPVWEGMGFEQAMQQMQAAGATPESDPDWVREQATEAVTLPGRAPCYFNSGCCSYSDGSITGIEIADGEVRLIRWEQPAQPRRVLVFPPASLRTVLAAVA